MATSTSCGSALDFVHVKCGLVVQDLHEHGKPGSFPSVLEGGLIEFVDHTGDTGAVAVPVDHKSGSSPLDRFNPVDIGLIVGILYCPIEWSVNYSIVEAYLQKHEIARPWNVSVICHFSKPDI